MKVLVTGVKGQLGYDVVKELENRGIPCIGADKEEFDLTDRAATEAFVREHQPDAVIHCAAYTAVDRAEEEKDLCRKINVEGTQNLFEAVRALHGKFLYVSTDYVFDGKGTEAFTPEHKKDPCNFYGMSKHLGEEVVLGYDALFLVRISWVFGKNGNNFIRTMLRLSESHDQVRVVDDQIGSPTYTADLARLLCDMIVTEKYGVYHATNEGYCSWADLAEFSFARAHRDTKVNRIPSREYPSKAARPMNSRLDKSKLDQMGFARLPTWQDAVSRYVAELLGENRAEDSCR